MTFLICLLLCLVLCLGGSIITISAVLLAALRSRSRSGRIFDREEP